MNPSMLPLRFQKKIRVLKSGCWKWLGYTDPQGYGRCKWEGTTRRTHQVVYWLLVGPTPAGKELDHLCRRKYCCNPNHLEPVVHVLNVQRGDGGQNHRVKKRCPRGHPYTKANTYRYPDGRRQCRKCNKVTATAYYQRNREAVKAKARQRYRAAKAA